MYQRLITHGHFACARDDKHWSVRAPVAHVRKSAYDVRPDFVVIRAHSHTALTDSWGPCQWRQMVRTTARALTNPKTIAVFPGAKSWSSALVLHRNKSTLTAHVFGDDVTLCPYGNVDHLNHLMLYIFGKNETKVSGYTGIPDIALQTWQQSLQSQGSHITVN